MSVPTSPCCLAPACRQLTAPSPPAARAAPPAACPPPSYLLCARAPPESVCTAHPPHPTPQLPSNHTGDVSGTCMFLQHRVCLPGQRRAPRRVRQEAACTAPCCCRTHTTPCRSTCWLKYPPAALIVHPQVRRPAAASTAPTPTSLSHDSAKKAPAPPRPHVGALNHAIDRFKAAAAIQALAATTTALLRELAIK